MLSVTYDACFSRFLAQVQAYDLAVVDEVDARQKLNSWLESIKSMPRVRKLFTSLSLDKNIETILFDLRNKFNDNDSKAEEEAEIDFVTEVFGLGVAWKWASEKYNSLLNTAQYFGSGDRRYFSQANHMTSLYTMSREGRGLLYGTIRDHGSYNNEYLEGES